MSMMHHTNIQFLTVWAYLSMLVYVQGSGIFNSSDEKFIIVNPLNTYNDHNSDSCICTGATCFCTELEDALDHLEDNTVITINGTIRGFIGNVEFAHLTNISILGYHQVAVVNCLAQGSFYFHSCNNIIIENITWISCGNNKDYRVL